jgi:hypothetical protein
VIIFDVWEELVIDANLKIRSLRSGFNLSESSVYGFITNFVFTGKRLTGASDRELL